MSDADNFIHSTFISSVIPTLCEYIKIPNQSPLFDSEINTNGYQKKVLKLLLDWAQQMEISGISMEVIQSEERTPVLLLEVGASVGFEGKDVVLLYGHADKQPPMYEAWSDGFAPYEPKIVNGKLYGRGGADDGYSMFAALVAIKALQIRNVKHGKFVVLITAKKVVQLI